MVRVADDLELDRRIDLAFEANRLAKYPELACSYAFRSRKRACNCVIIDTS